MSTSDRLTRLGVPKISREGVLVSSLDPGLRAERLLIQNAHSATESLRARMWSWSGVKVVVTDVAVIFSLHSFVRGQGSAQAAGFGWVLEREASEIADGGFER